MSKIYKDKIIGVWENISIKYCFYDDNSMEIIWKKNHNKEDGNYSINTEKIIGNPDYVDIITFRYGFNRTANWRGRIINITENELSIEDLSEDVGQIDIMYKVSSSSLSKENITNSQSINKHKTKFQRLEDFAHRTVHHLDFEPSKIGLTKYILSCTLLVFFTLLAYEWISNIDEQVINFFSVYRGSFVFYLLVLIIGVVAFTISALSLIGVFSFLHAGYKIGFEVVLKKINLKSIPKLIAISPFLFISLLSNEMKVEKVHNKYRVPFFIFAFILILFIGGSPLINNYKAVYLNYEVYSDNDGNTTYKEKQTYVFDKDDTELIKRKINEMGEEKNIKDMFDEDEYHDLDYFGSSRKYLFNQTALIEGFKSYKKNTSGFFNYISCLIYFSIEKFIVTLIYFLIPFMAWIGISMYRDKN